MNNSLLGTTIGGKYAVQSLIGEGGMCRVYRAVQTGVDRPVAIKVLRKEFSNAKGLKRMEREARTLSELTHPNLVAIFDTGITETQQPYHVFEYLDGISLSDLIDSEGHMPANRAIPIFIQICDVMQYAHDGGFIDRDISPDNVILIKAAGMDDFVKLIDFGVMKYDESQHVVSQRLTATGEVCGNPMYMSPEQATGEELDLRTDIYSLGVVMWETLTGKPLFAGSNIAEIITKHLYSKVPTPSLINAEIPAALDEIVLKALEKSPSARFQSMNDLKSELSQVLRRLHTVDANLPAYYGKNVGIKFKNFANSVDSRRNIRRLQHGAYIAIQPSSNTIKDLTVALLVAACAGACICFLLARFIVLR